MLVVPMLVPVVPIGLDLAALILAVLIAAIVTRVLLADYF